MKTSGPIFSTTEEGKKERREKERKKEGWLTFWVRSPIFPGAGFGALRPWRMTPQGAEFLLRGTVRTRSLLLHHGCWYSLRWRWCPCRILTGPQHILPQRPVHHEGRFPGCQRPGRQDFPPRNTPWPPLGQKLQAEPQPEQSSLQDDSLEASKDQCPEQEPL